jgi:hypothetical protein
MVSVMRHTRLGALLSASILVVTTAATPVKAGGNHFGWCKGVGNPHHNAGCPGTGSSSTTGTGLPTTPQTKPGGGTGPQLVNPGNTLPPTTGGGGTQTGGQPQTPQQIIVVVPNPPTVIGGYGPGQPIVGQSGGFVGGRSTLPTPVPQAIPQEIPTPVPYSIPTPQPQAIPQLVPQPQTIIVVPQPPTTISGYGRPPAIIGQTSGFVGGNSAVPTPIPQAVPYPRPYPIPTAVPNKIPQLIPTPSRRPSPGSGTGGVTVVHNKTPGKAGDAHKHVTPQAGRQKAHAIPRFTDTERGGTVDCVASGLHRRVHIGPDGKRTVSGALSHVELPDPVARDVPAEKPLHAGCLVKIKRKVRR